MQVCEKDEDTGKRTVFGVFANARCCLDGRLVEISFQAMGPVDRGAQYCRCRWCAEEQLHILNL